MTALAGITDSGDKAKLDRLEEQPLSGRSRHMEQKKYTQELINNREHIRMISSHDGSKPFNLIEAKHNQSDTSPKKVPEEDLRSQEQHQNSSEHAPVVSPPRRANLSNIEHLAENIGDLPVAADEHLQTSPHRAADWHETDENERGSTLKPSRNLFQQDDP